MAEDAGEQIPRPSENTMAPIQGRAIWALVWVALACAVFAAGYVGHRLYVEMTRVDPLASLREQFAGQISEQSGRLGELNRKLSELDTRDTDVQAQTEDKLATLSKRMDDTELKLNEAQAPNERRWKLAEVEYLLRIANHRAILEQDVRGALQLTQAADEVLASMDDMSLHEVRAELAREITALKMVPGLDVTGIYARIEGLSANVGKLDQRKPFAREGGDVAAAAEGAPAPERSVWGTIADRLLRFVKIEVSPALPRRPQLTSDELEYVHEMLRLQLEQAKLGLLRKDQNLYVGSLKSVGMWVTDYLDPQAAASVAFLDELAALEQIQLAVAMPDISGSLNLLRDLRRAEEG